MGDDRTRLKHIDVAKGIAILCMIFGHFYVCHGCRWMNPFIYTWHMPLFFFLSGCFLNTNGSWGEFVSKRLRRLIVPYVAFGLLGILLCLSARVVTGTFEGSWLIDRFSCLLYGNGAPISNSLWGHKGDCGVIWFLLALFESSIVVRLLLGKSKWMSGWGALLVTLLIAWVVLAYVRSGAPWLPLGVQQSMVAIVYVCAGSLCMNKTHLVTKPLGAVAVVGFIFWLVLGTQGYTMSLSRLCIEPIWLVLASFPIIYFVLWLSNKIVSSPFGKPLLWMGSNSLGILCAHHLYLSGMGYSVCSFVVRKVGISYGGAILMLIDFVFPIAMIALWMCVKEKFNLDGRFSK